MRRLCDVVVPHTRLDELTYDCTGLPDPVAPGDCVEVRLRGRRIRAIVVSLPTSASISAVKPVERLIEHRLVPPCLLALESWLADYYCCFRGEALGAVLPRGIGGYRPRTGNDGSSFRACEPQVGSRRAGSHGFAVELAITGAERFSLVTGFLDGALQRGGGILLLPEPQLEHWRSELRARYDDLFAEYHARLGPTGLKRRWLDIRTGGHRVVAGVRSAVFAPVMELGGIVVVDSHDPVYKEERHPRYNARDVAIVRARAADCPVLLVDPLPAVETWYNVTKGHYRLHGEDSSLSLETTSRPRRYPAARVVDIRRLRGGLISPRLQHDLERLSEDSAAMLYVNRKGLSRRVACGECGAALECPECRLPMTLSSAGRTQGAEVHLNCGLCGLIRPAPETCPECEGVSFELHAVGVESVAREASALLPDRLVVRVESDCRQKVPRGAIAVGTRTLLGMPWPEPVGLVAAVGFDYEMSLPDFRVRERAFAVLASLVSRAEESSAKLLIQTRWPSQSLVESGLSRDLVGFLTEELKARREAGLPPWRRLALVEVSRGNRGTMLNHARHLARVLDSHQGVDVVGPVESRQGAARLLVRFPRNLMLGRLLERSLLKKSRLTVRVDVDPGDTL